MVPRIQPNSRAQKKKKKLNRGEWGRDQVDWVSGKLTQETARGKKTAFNPPRKT